MQIYTVQITETLQRQIEIFAKNPFHAHELISDKYGEGKLVLSSEDFVDFSIDVIE